MPHRITLTLCLLLWIALPARSLSNKTTLEDLRLQCEHARSRSHYADLDFLSRRLLAASRKAGDARGMGYASLYSGLALLFTGRGTEAGQALDRAWELSRETGNDSIGALVMNARGIYQAMYQNNNFLAQRFFFRSLDLAEDAGYEALKIRVYGNLLILSRTVNDAAGLAYARDIYKYGMRRHDVEQEFMGAYYLALYYELRRDYRAALGYVRRALRLYDRHQYDDVAAVYVLYAEVETELGQLGQALRLSEKAVALAEKYGQTSLMPDAHLQRGEVLHRMGHYAESNRDVERALALAETHELSNRKIDAYRLRARNDLRMGDKDGAIHNLLLANRGMDTLSRVNMDRLMREREMLERMQRQERQAEVKRRQLADQRRMLATLGGVTAILLVGLGAILLVLRSRNRLIRRIVAQNVQAVERQEKARLRIAELEQAQGGEGAQEAKAPAGLLDDEGRRQQLYDRVCELMEQEKPYKEPQLTREKLAAMLGTNRTYLSTAIREKSGMSYQQFVNSYRIGEAVRILSNRDSADYPLKQLWSDLGFTSSSTFYKLFQQTVGITPSVYRKRALEIGGRETPPGSDDVADE